MPTERDKRLEEIERLWKEKKKTPLSELDKAINIRFEVGDGRNSLDFYAMDLIKEGLEKL